MLYLDAESEPWIEESSHEADVVLLPELVCYRVIPPCFELELEITAVETVLDNLKPLAFLSKVDLVKP